MRSLRVLLVSCVFFPEPVVSAKTSASLVAGLVGRGDVVAVVTSFPNRPAGRLYPGYKRQLYQGEDSREGFTLVRCFSFFSPASSMLSRWLENISFGVTSSLALLNIPKPDVVYANTWPIFATGLIGFVCRLRKIPLVASVQDLYPESLVMQGRIKQDGLIYKFLLWLDRWISRQASAVIVISEKFAEAFIQERRIPAARVHVIPNWVEASSMIVMDKNIYRQEAGIASEAFVLVYGGNVGTAAEVETVIEAMRIVIARREVVLVIAGSGSQLEACQKLAAEVSNIRIVFHSPWAAEETFKVLAAADVLLLPTRGYQSLASVPSKLLSYLLAARPVLACVLPQSDTAQIIEKTGCGWIVPPDNPDLLAKQIEVITGLSAQTLEEMGATGREYALQNFTSETCLPEVIQIIANAANRKV